MEDFLRRRRRGHSGRTSIRSTSRRSRVGAMTRSGALTGFAARPFRVHRPYGVLRGRRARRGVDPIGGGSGIALHDDAAVEVAGRSRGTPRIANRLLRRVRDYAEVRGDGEVTLPIARAALVRVYDVDERASDRLDRAVLSALVWASAAGRSACRRWRWQSARSRRRWKRSANPSWCAPGSSRAPRGRVATAAAWHHLSRPGAARLGR